MAPPGATELELPLTREAKAAAAAADVPETEVAAAVAVIETLADVVAACSSSGAGDNDVEDVGDEQSLCKLKAGDAEA